MNTGEPDHRLGVLRDWMAWRDDQNRWIRVPLRHVFPVHHKDCALFKSPLADFRCEVERCGLSDAVTYLDPGQAAEIRSR